jgi:glycosyltransferase involved in cell wall biosynthesis
LAKAIDGIHLTQPNMSHSSDPERRRKVLLLAYLCSPHHGSEAKIGWNFAVEMAKHVDLWVIALDDVYGEGTRRRLAERGPVAGLHFEWVARPRWLRALRRVPGMYYAAYNLWHRRAFRAAQRLHAQQHFDLVHQLNLCGYREPGYLWKLDAPFVWGPVGGTQNFPWRFLGEAGFLGAIGEAARSVANVLQLRLSRRVAGAAHAAAVLFTANSTNWRDFRRVHRLTPRLLLETGVTAVEPAQRPPPAGRELHILWSGDLAPWKGLPLLLKALRQMPPEIPYQVRILGKGRLRKCYERLARACGVDRHITWLGWLPFDEALRQNAWADVLAFTSLRDTSGNVVLEALSAGVPVVCLDHQGAADMITDACGIKIPVTRPRQVTRELAQAITVLAQDHELRRRLSAGALRRAADYLWSARVEQVAAVYREILEPAGPPAPCCALQGELA